MSIRIITEPKIYLIGRQTIDDTALTRFLADEDVSQWTTDTEEAGETLVECAGRLCYKSYARPRPGGNAAYIGHILEVGHGSVLEHAVFNLIVTGVSRSLTHELVRHRVGISPSQLSQRYCDESDAAFVVPPEYADDVANAMRFFELYRESQSFDDYTDACDRTLIGVPASWEGESICFGLEWLAAMEYARWKYERFSDRSMKRLTAIEDKTARRKAAREAARSVLPNATETQIFITANARALRHFLELRGSAAADAEMRRLAIAMLKVLANESKNLFGDYTIANGSIETPYKKV